MARLTRRNFIGLGVTAAATVALTGCGGGGGAAASSAAAGAATSAAAGGAGPMGTGQALEFKTGGESGTYYAFGSVIAQHAVNTVGVNLNAVVGNGSQANVQDLQDGISDVAFCQSDVEAYAFEGTNIFADTGAVNCFSTVACLYDEQVQIVTCDENIKTVEDLKGKNVSIGASGSGVYFNAIDILGVYGLSEADINPTYQSFGDSANDLKDGKIDAAFIVAGAPTTAITDLSTSKQAYLVSLDSAHVDQLLAASPYYSKATIPGGTYAGVDEDVTTVAVGAVIIANDTVSEDDIYALCFDIFEDPAALVENHAKYGEVSIDKGASITAVPYHPGAAKYFEEKGKSVAVK